MKLKLICLIFAGWFSVVGGKAQKQPNIIIIMADDMGYSDIGCYGSEIPTPNIDKLAGNGIRFTQFYNNARCCPTRASLMTGLFPHQTGIGHMTEEPENEKGARWGTPGYQGSLNTNCVTIAEALKPAGYHTYMTGKWHLGQSSQDKWPLQRGFEKYYGILSGASSYLKPQGGRGLTYNNIQLSPPQGNYYTTDAFTDSAISFIKEQKDQKPFFLYVAYNAPHWPLQAKQKDINAFEGIYEKGWDVIRRDRINRQRKLGLIDSKTVLSPRDSMVRDWNKLTKAEQKDVAYRMAVYAAQIKCMDENVGKLIQTLTQQGKLDNTLIMFLSDNGACPEPYKELGGGKMEDINNPELWGPVSYGMGWANASNTPYRKWKRELEEGGMKAPFIAHWPNGINKNRRNKVLTTPFNLMDIMPTLLDLSGANYPDQVNGNKIYALEGKSMAPVFSGKSLTQKTLMFWEHEGNQAIRKDNWKAIKDNNKSDWELYNLTDDRVETKNVANQNPAILSGLVSKWEAWAKSHFVFPKRKGDVK